MTCCRNFLAIDIAYMSLLRISRDINNILQMSAYFIAIADAMVITQFFGEDVFTVFPGILRMKGGAGRIDAPTSVGWLVGTDRPSMAEQPAFDRLFCRYDR